MSIPPNNTIIINGRKTNEKAMPQNTTTRHACKHSSNNSRDEANPDKEKKNFGDNCYIYNVAIIIMAI